MRRLLTVFVVMAAMVAVTAMPALAYPKSNTPAAYNVGPGGNSELPGQNLVFTSKSFRQ